MAREAVVPEQWREFYASTGVPAAVRSGDLLHVTGHTGEVDGVFSPDVERQIRQAFENLGATLLAAGSGWDEVVAVTTYHVGLRDQAEIMLTVAAEFLAVPYPAWTAVGVSELFEPEARFEISAVAARSGSGT